MPNWVEHIGDLYKGVMDDSLWTLTINRIMEEAGASLCLQVCPYIDPSSDAHQRMGCQIYKDTCPFYEAYHEPCEHGLQYHASIEGNRLLCSDIQADFSKGSEKKRLRCAIPFDGGLVNVPSLYCAQTFNECAVRDERFISEMLPHLQCALRIRWQMVKQHHASSLHEEVLGKIPQAMALLDESGHVLFTNRRAKAIFQETDGFFLVNNQLAMHGAQRGLVKDALRQAAQGIDSSVLLDDMERQRRWAVAFSPLCLSGSHTVPITRILAQITNLEQVSMEGLLHFAKLYGLTKAESRVLHHLVRLQNTKEIAEILGISIKTLRIHLGNLFCKTSTASQRELVQFFQRHPSISTDSSEE